VVNNDFTSYIFIPVPRGNYEPIIPFTVFTKTIKNAIEKSE